MIRNQTLLVGATSGRSEIEPLLVDPAGARPGLVSRLAGAGLLEIESSFNVQTSSGSTEPWVCLSTVSLNSWVAEKMRSTSQDRGPLRFVWGFPKSAGERAEGITRLWSCNRPVIKHFTPATPVPHSWRPNYPDRGKWGSVDLPKAAFIKRGRFVSSLDYHCHIASAQAPQNVLCRSGGSRGTVFLSPRSAIDRLYLRGEPLPRRPLLMKMKSALVGGRARL